MKNILITGGCGYIGRNLYRLFNEDSKENSNKYNVYAPSKTILDLLNVDKIEYTFKNFKPDVVIHTAIQGGDRIKKDSIDIIKNNVEMYENLMNFVSDDMTTFVFGSGAEFDRRKTINCVDENEIYNRFPIDPYGISKSIISKQAIQDIRKIYVLRLFGCFNHDEENFRFIKSCILNIKHNKPIQINQNKHMDFFYMDDIFTVIDNIINNADNGEYNMNLVYNTKYTLKHIVNKVKCIMKKENWPVLCHNRKIKYNYTGNGLKLQKMNLNLIGLDEGIKKTVESLL